MINESFWSPVLLSVEVASIALIFVLIIGNLFAGFMHRKNFRGKVIIETIILLPIVLPPTVVGFLLIVVFGVNSPIGRFIETLFDQPIMFTWWAAVIASTVVAFPLMYQACKTGFLSIEKEIEDAARVDGASEWKSFLFITLPLAYKAIISGAILSFARALGEFGATLMFAGNLPGITQTMPTAIYVALESGNMTLAWMWVIVTIFISFIMLLVSSLIK
ncbi:molybdate ABC transporter permease subunit [Robertmurraya yapensis]|uniref:Molybdenum transport system permease n=1 Tax=Bacillus yapensis TaxID=2492960 RepID=A0A3S0I6Q2_9BACI|nr:molybdate ABC transporter permease subunit [Bacillus yapensis]RTR28754.1 molybdate ABC transporter permease subunit [Bacillus yapensis]TKS94611.1 molybdate ABC transporter permease subunit [Bacillus yapensis]